MIKTEDKLEQAWIGIKRVQNLAKSAEKDIERMRADRDKMERLKLTNSQAARILGVSPRTVIRYKKSGRLKSMSYTDVMDFK